MLIVLIKQRNGEVIFSARAGSPSPIRLIRASLVTKIVILASSTIIFSSCALVFNEMLERKRRHSDWVQGHLQSCDKHGAYKCLVRDLEVHAELKRAGKSTSVT